MSSASFDTLGTAHDLGSAEFRGCESFHLPASGIDRYDGRLEFWDGDIETAWKVRQPTTIQHEAPSRRLGHAGAKPVALKSRIAVCLPHAEEGFYLPALEAMASGCIVVTLDCVGNRGVCRHGDNCLVVEPNAESLLDMTRRARTLSASERGSMHRRARDTAASHSLGAERARFHAVLGDVDRLWRMG